MITCDDCKFSIFNQCTNKNIDKKISNPELADECDCFTDGWDDEDEDDED